MPTPPTPDRTVAARPEGGVATARLHRRLDRTFAHAPITHEPVDGYFVVGALLVVIGAAGLLTGAPALVLCGVATVTGVALLQLSGREDRPPAPVSGMKSTTGAPPGALALPSRKGR